MPAPSAADFARLRALVAIDDVEARQSKPIDEVFTGKELTTIPVGTADGCDRRLRQSPRRAERSGPSARSRNAPRSSSVSAPCSPRIATS